MKRNRTGLIQKPLGVSGAPGKGMWASGGTDTLPGPRPAFQPRKQLRVNSKLEKSPRRSLRKSSQRGSQTARQQDNTGAESHAAKKYSKLTPAKCLLDLARRKLCVVSPCAGERQKTQAKKQAETACVSNGEERENPLASGITHEWCYRGACRRKRQRSTNYQNTRTSELQNNLVFEKHSNVENTFADALIPTCLII